MTVKLPLLLAGACIAAATLVPGPVLAQDGQQDFASQPIWRDDVASGSPMRRFNGQRLRFDVPRAAERDFRRGLEYQQVRGGPPDFERAASHFRLAAERGHPLAMFALAVLLEAGSGVPQDLAQAADLYEKSARTGYAQAQYNLGLIFARGAGRPQDMALARQWYAEAAGQGMMEAQYNLAMLLADDAQTEQAYKWLAIASRDGNKKARRSLDELASTMSGEQRARAEALAAEWKAM